MTPPVNGTIRVVLADDKPVIVDVLAKLVGDQPDLEVVGIGRNAEEALMLCVEHNPDVAVLDVRVGSPGTELEFAL